MTTDFEYKLKENLIKDVDATNIDVLSEVMRTPFEEKKKTFSFFNMPRRAVATLCASMLLLCVGIFASTSLSQPDSATPMPMTANDMARTIESESINVSSSLQSVLLECEMTDTIEVAVLTSLEESDFIYLASLDRELTADDFSTFLYAQDEILIVELEKSDIINMKDYFYFMLPSDIS